MHIASKASNGEAVQGDLQMATATQEGINKQNERERSKKNCGFFFSGRRFVINFWGQ